MKKLCLLLFPMFFSIIPTTSLFSQTSGTFRIGLINSQQFYDDKEGIKKINTADAQLNNEFTPLQKELDLLSGKLKDINNEIDVIRENAKKGIYIGDAKYQLKVDEAERLSRDVKFKQEDAKARYERRKEAIFNPIMNDISKALNNYSKTKLYSFILDFSKLYESGVLLAIGDDKVDITKDFITYYNNL